MPRCATRDPTQIRTLLSAAAQYRLETKNRRWQRLVAVRGYDQALFQSLAVTLGYKENKLPFALLAQRLPLKVLRAETGASMALLLGLAGFLQTPEPASGAAAMETRAYLRECWEHWWPQRSALERLALPAGSWKLGGLRPANHPQRRLAALAQLARQWPAVRALIEQGGGDFAREVTKFLTGLRDPYWDHHYTLLSARSERPLALIGTARATEMLANVFFPLAIAAHPERWAAYEKLPAATTNRRVETAAVRLFGGGSEDAGTHVDEDRRPPARAAANLRGLLPARRFRLRPLHVPRAGATFRVQRVLSRETL